MATIGGRNLGTATGTIRVDTSQVDSAAVTVQRAGKNIKASIGGAAASVDVFIDKFRAAGAGADNFGTRIKKLGRGVNELRGELLAVGVAGAVLTKVGLGAAASFQDARVQLKGLVGSEKEAVALMERLRTSASKAGVPFSEVLAASTKLLPTLEGNTAELEKWLPIVRRVAVLNRQEGISGAAFSINEAISSGGTDLVSLTERFNISRNQLRDALAQTDGDLAAALDLVLTKMGITIDTADEMGQGFTASLNRAKDAAGQLAAVGFTPLLNALTPILQKTADWLTVLRETSPAVASFGAGLAGIVAVGAPVALALGQIISLAEKLKALGVLSKLAALAPALGSAGVLGAAAVGGSAIGLQVGRGIGRAAGNEAVANTTAADVWETARRLIFIGVSILTEAFGKVATVFVQGSTLFLQALSAMSEGVAGFIRQLADALPPSLGGDKLAAIADGLAGAYDASIEYNKQFLDNLGPAQDNFLRGALEFLGLADKATQQADAAAATPPAATGGGFNQDQTQAITDYYDNLASIESSRRQQTLDAEKSYNDQRAQIQQDYTRTAARDEQDFARSRRRQNQQLQRDIADITEDRLKREAQWQQDLSETIANLRNDVTERIAELREEGNARIEEIESDYNDRREQAAREHRDTLLNAASRLDAGAIAAEQRRYATQTATAEDEFQKRVAKERESLQERLQQEQENLQERIQQEQEAHAERIQEAREADAERIADMREALARQQQIEDEDRRIRLRRTQEDHRRQLEELAKASRKRISEIQRAAAEERAELKKNFQDQLFSLGIANEAYLREQEDQQEKALENFEKYWSDWNKIIKEQKPGGGSFAAGGPVTYTGMAAVHGSNARPEYMLSADTTSRLRGMIGNVTQAGILAAVSGNRGGMNIGSISMPIYAAAGQSPNDIAVAVEQRLMSLFRSMS